MTLSNDSSARLYRKVADDLIKSIRNGDYIPGQKLPTERELAESFQVSRPTVREALIALEILGFVEIRHGSGITVLEEKPELSDNNVDLNVGAFELMEARMIIEGETAALAAFNATDEDIIELKRFVALMNSHIVAEAVSGDRHFHLYIARMTNNSALIDCVARLWDLRETSPLASKILSRTLEHSLSDRIYEHSNVLHALEQRDPAAARQAMRSHLEKVRDYVLEATETEEIENLRLKLKEKRDALLRRSGTSD